MQEGREKFDLIANIEEFNQNRLQTQKNGRDKFDLTAKIENLGVSIKILTMRLKVSR